MNVIGFGGRTARGVAVFGVLVCGALSVLAQGQPADDQPQTVTVQAEGLNRADAVRQALRSAIEQVAGVILTSHSEVKNYQLLKDTILSRSEGIVSDYKVLEEWEGPDSIKVKVEAKVRRGMIANMVNEVLMLLEQKGQPRIVVFVEEYIDGRYQENDSIVETRLNKMLLKVGFDVVDRMGDVELQGLARERAKAEAIARNDDQYLIRKLSAIAQSKSAQVLIYGTAHANNVGHTDRIYDITTFPYNCDARISARTTDSAMMILAESIQSRSASLRAREFSDTAAREALERMAFPDPERRRPEDTLGDKVYRAIMEKWSREVGGVGGDIDLEIEDIDTQALTQVKDALEALVSEKGGKVIRTLSLANYADFKAKFTIKANVRTQDFALNVLSKPPFIELFSISGFQSTTINAKAVKRR